MTDISKRPVGRPRKYPDRAAKQAAYRERKAQTGQAQREQHAAALLQAAGDLPASPHRATLEQAANFLLNGAGHD